MKLNRRYTRNIRENLSFYIASTILTIVTLLLYFLFNIAGNAILDFSEDFYERNQVEDAHFTTYMAIPEEELAKLSDTYHVTTEAQRYINIETDGVTARVFSRTEKVDLYEVTQGKDAERDNEIVISEGYAVANAVSIGSRMKIGDKEYTVAGFMQRPDYLYMLESEEDAYKNVSTFYLCYMTGSAFEALGDTGCQYLVRYTGDSDITGFRKAVHEQYYMRSYSSAAENPRITMVEQQAQMFIVMAYVLLCILPLIAVVLISIIISRKVKSEQRMIGTLSALGYKKGQLMRHYAGFAVIPGLVGGVFTAIISAIAAQPLSEMGLQDYEPMHVAGHLNPLAALLGLLVPTALYVIAALLSVRRLLKKDTVLLLSGNADGGKKKLRRVLAGNKMSFRIKLAIRSLLGNPARSLVILLGVFLGFFIMLLGQGFFDSINRMGDTAAEAAGSFEHQYILNEMLTENPYGGDTMLVSAVEHDGGSKLSVIGTTDSNPYLEPKDADGNIISIENGYYITSLAQLTLGWQTGDTVTVYNPLSLEKKEIQIAGVIQNHVQKSIITSKRLAAELTGLDENSFNCIVSSGALSIPEAKIAQESQRSDITEQAKTMTAQMDFLLQMIIGLGIVICIAAVYVAVNMLVTESRSNISMLKVLGYRDKQINKIVLRTHHILLPIGILLAIPCTYAAAHAFFLMMVDYGVMLIDTYISPKSYILSILLTAGCYFGSLWLLRRKVKKVDMIESLKDNRE
ncbi:ABC transporter permease [Bianquea renquensis]|uniref:FtsX-like permease family protein n=1 Tax=Bianquea renquensis TaxID=2763661 RepID=A0A926DNG9_9FIRM|nr:FtsX-like permease family protein [Bianquea renquensis]MBC8542228.1 FtsX-like permease family protein [Bianquea renquensis]